MNNKEIINYLIENKEYLGKKDIKLFIHSIKNLNYELTNVERNDIFKCLKNINEKILDDESQLSKKRLKDIFFILEIIMKEKATEEELKYASYMIDSLYYDLDLPLRENNVVGEVLYNKVNKKRGLR